MISIRTRIIFCGLTLLVIADASAGKPRRRKQEARTFVKTNHNGAESSRGSGVSMAVDSCSKRAITVGSPTSAFSTFMRGKPVLSISAEALAAIEQGKAVDERILAAIPQDNLRWLVHACLLRAELYYKNMADTLLKRCTQTVQSDLRDEEKIRGKLAAAAVTEHERITALGRFFAISSAQVSALAYRDVTCECNCALFPEDDTEKSAPDATVNFFRTKLVEGSDFYDEVVLLDNIAFDEETGNNDEEEL